MSTQPYTLFGRKFGYGLSPKVHLLGCRGMHGAASCNVQCKIRIRQLCLQVAHNVKRCWALFEMLLYKILYFLRSIEQPMAYTSLGLGLAFRNPSYLVNDHSIGTIIIF
jgi:hypothetical protein